MYRKEEQSMLAIKENDISPAGKIFFSNNSNNSRAFQFIENHFYFIYKNANSVNRKLNWICYYICCEHFSHIQTESCTSFVSTSNLL